MTLLLALLSAALPLYLVRFKIGPIPTTVLEVLVWIIILAWFVRELRIKKQESRSCLSVILYSRFLIPVMMLLLAATISMLISPHLRAATGIWKAYFAEPVVIFLIAVATMKTARDRRLILYGLSIGALVVSGWAITQKFTGWGIPPAWVDPATRRVTSFFGYPNAVGLYLGPLIPLFVAMAFHSPRPPSSARRERVGVRVELLLVGILSLLAILFARSFGALAGVAGACIAMGLVAKKTRVWTIAAVAAVSLFIAFSPLRKPFADEFLLQGFSGKLRVAMWAETIEMLRDRPIFGAGLSGYQSAVAPYHIYPWAEIYLYPHNIILNFWSETGILGLLAFGWILAILVRMAWTRVHSPSPPREGEGGGEGKYIALGLFGSFAAILVHGLVDAPYFKNDLSVMFWLLAALTVAVSRDTMKNNNSSRGL